MSTQVQGLPLTATLQIPIPVNIASSTDATPIVVTTAVPHGINAGDALYIDSHHVNSKAIGVWIAQSVTPTTITLYASVGTGAGPGGATGFVQSLVPGDLYPEPSDGDAPNASSVNTAFQAIADKLALIWLYARSGTLAGQSRSSFGTIADSATAQFIDCSSETWIIPATLSHGVGGPPTTTTVTMLRGRFDGMTIDVIRAQTPDANEITLTGPSGEVYHLAGSIAGWIRLRWEGSFWRAIGNGSGWTGTYPLA